MQPNAAPINDIAERWINRYDQPRVDALSDLKKALEDTTMDKPEFVYTTFIRTTPEQLWRGLTDPAFTRRYWGVAFDSDWKPGSAYALTLTQGDVTIDDPGQVVTESEPFRRLAYTWHTFTPEWAAAYNISDDYLARVTAEGRSTVTFEIEPLGDLVKLTVVHDGFAPGSVVLPDISDGWPRILSGLKTLLETGESLPVG